MNVAAWIHATPLWVVFLFSVAISLCAVECGAALARFSPRWSKDKEPDAPLGSLVGGMSGARRMRGTPLLAIAFSLVILMMPIWIDPAKASWGSANSH